MEVENVLEPLNRLATVLGEARGTIERSELDGASGKVDKAERVVEELRSLVTGESREEDVSHLKVVLLSQIAFENVCGLVQPGDAVDPEELVAPDVVWDEIYLAFPLSAIQDEDEEDEADTDELEELDLGRTSFVSGPAEREVGR